GCRRKSAAIRWLYQGRKVAGRRKCMATGEPAARQGAQEIVSSPEVVMYSTDWCPYCDRARALLDRKGVLVTQIKVDEDPQQREIMLKRSGGRRSVPQIFIGGRHIGGFK